MELNDDNILGFWQWFVKNENIIKECIENEGSTQKDYVVEQMNEQILSLGMLTWDIGLNDENSWFLMLSPNGKPEMFEVSQKIMDSAPDDMGWLFYSSKPAKVWDRKFTVYDDYMDEKFIDATSWSYVVFEEEDGTLELMIEAKNLPHLDVNVIETAAEQFVIQEIGESTRILLISSIVIIHTLENEYENAKAPITELKEHLEEIG